MKNATYYGAKISADEDLAEGRALVIVNHYTIPNKTVTAKFDQLPYAIIEMRGEYPTAEILVRVSKSDLEFLINFAKQLTGNQSFWRRVLLWLTGRS